MSFIAANSNSSGASSTLTVSRPAGAAVGDRILAIVGYSSGGSLTVTGPGGTWQKLQNLTQGDTQFAELWTYVIEDATTSWNFTLSGAPSGSGGTISVAYTSCFIDTSAAGVGTNSAATTNSGSVTTAGPGTVVVLALCNAAGGPYTPPATWTERFDDTGLGTAIDKDFASSTTTGTIAISGAAQDRVAFTVAIYDAIVEQEGYRWRDDDGSEAAASWLASQDANITRAADTNTRLRVLLNATNDPGSAQYQLEYRLSGGSFAKVPTSSTPAAPAFGSQGAVATGGTTSVSVAYPTPISAGDLLVLFMAVRNGAATITTPTGFTAPSNNTASGGAGAEGADAGTSKCAVYYREADGSESGSLSVTVGNSPSTATGIMLRYTKDGWASWSIAAAQGTDTASGDTSWSAAMNVDPGIAIGDVLLSCIVPNTDASTWSAQDVTGTGLASALVSERTETGVTTPGNDLDIIVCEHDVTAALTSGVPTVVATSSGTTPEGSTVLLRIRTTGMPAMVMSASANVTASGEATTAQLTAPSGKSTSDFDAGRLQDDENPADAVDITADDYTELEWCVKANGAAVSAAQVYEFRVTSAGNALSTYTVTPQWTIGGGTTFTSSLSGTLSTSGTVVRQTRRALTGSVPSSGAVVKSVSRALVAAVGSAGSLTKHTAKAFTGGVASTGALTAIRSVLLALTGALASSGQLVKRTATAKVGTVASAGALTRQASKAFTGSVASAGALVAIRTVLAALSGAVTSTGALLKQTARSLTGVATSTGVLVRSPRKTLSGALTPTGAFTAIKAVFVNLAGAVLPTGALMRRSSKPLAGSVPSTGALERLVGKRLAGTVASAGTLLPIKAVFASVSGALSPAGTLSRRTFRAITGALSPAGSLVKRPARAFTGAMATAGALIRLRMKVLSGSAGSSGTLSSRTSKGLTGALAPGGGLTKRVARSFTGLLGFIGSVLGLVLGGQLGRLLNTGVSSLVARYHVRSLQQARDVVSLAPRHGVSRIGD